MEGTFHSCAQHRVGAGEAHTRIYRRQAVWGESAGKPFDWFNVRPQSFVLVRIYADGSRVRIGPAMSLDDAWGCLCWWNYLDGGRYEAETL